MSTPNPSESDLAAAVAELNLWASAYRHTHLGDCFDTVLAALASAQRDGKRLDWLDGEMDREEDALLLQRRLPTSLFRMNVPITREAIDAAMSKEPPL